MATINDGLSVYHLSTGTHRAWQPAKGNFFEFIVSDFDNLLKPGVDPTGQLTADDYITNGQEAIRLTVSKANVPHFEMDPIDIQKGNSVVHYAGVPKFTGGEITIDDMIGIQSKAVLEAWQNLAYNVITDKGGRAINYKKECTLLEYTSDHVLVRSWRLIGCWVSSVSEDAYDKTQDGLRNVTATVQYDRAIPELENV